MANFILTALAGGVMIAGLVFLLVRRNRKAEVEKDKMPIFTIKCGGNLGGLGLSNPFVRLALYDDFLVIGYTETAVIRYDKIERIVQDRVLCGSVLEIYHRDYAERDITLSFFTHARAVEVRALIEERVNRSRYRFHLPEAN